MKLLTYPHRDSNLRGTAQPSENPHVRVSVREGAEGEGVPYYQKAWVLARTNARVCTTNALT